MSTVRVANGCILGKRTLRSGGLARLAALAGIAMCAFIFPGLAQAATVSLTGWNQDLIAEKTAASPTAGSTTDVSSWVWYEVGAPSSTQGLPSSGQITSLWGSNVSFQFQPFTATNNTLVLGSGGSSTMTLTTPGKFLKLQFLNSAQGGNGMSYSAKLNFADSTSTTLGPVSDPDWTQSGQNARSNVGLVTRGGTWSGYYAGTLNIFEHDWTLSPGDQAKTLNSITFNVTAGGYLMFFALSGDQPQSAEDVPEPACIILLMTALPAVVARLRRRVRVNG